MDSIKERAFDKMPDVIELGLINRSPKNISIELLSEDFEKVLWNIMYPRNQLTKRKIDRIVKAIKECKRSSRGFSVDKGFEDLKVMRGRIAFLAKKQNKHIDQVKELWYNSLKDRVLQGPGGKLP